MAGWKLKMNRKGAVSLFNVVSNGLFVALAGIGIWVISNSSRSSVVEDLSTQAQETPATDREVFGFDQVAFLLFAEAFDRAFAVGSDDSAYSMLVCAAREGEDLSPFMFLRQKWVKYRPQLLEVPKDDPAHGALASYCKEIAAHQGL